MKTLVLGLGNDLLADDAVGLLAADELKNRLAGRADVVGTSWHGLALLEFFIGYQRAIVMDSVRTFRHAPGTIIEMDGGALRPARIPSPHFAGWPEMLHLAHELGIIFPPRVRIFAVEVADASTIGGSMTPAVRRAVPELCARVCQAVSAYTCNRK